MFDFDNLDTHHATLISVNRNDLETFLNDLVEKIIIKVSKYNIEIIEPDGKFIKKEQIKILKKNMSLTVINDECYYIIKNAEKMNASAYNSMLKFLEEPPPGIYAILITVDLNNIPETIKSRCVLKNATTDSFNKNIDYGIIEEYIENKNYILFKKEITALCGEKKDLDDLEGLLYNMLEKSNNKISIIKIINDLKYNVNLDLLIDKIYIALTK